MRVPTRFLTSLSALVLAAAACGPGTQPSAAPTMAPAAQPTAAAPARPTTAPAAQATSAPAGQATSAAAPAIAISGPFQDEAKSLHGAGATFPAPLYQKWFSEYVNLTQVQVNYQAIGSGGGIKGIQDQTVDFGASDAPMTDEQIAGAKGGEVFHIPTSLGAIVPTYNLPNVRAKLKFTGDTLAASFWAASRSGTIRSWSPITRTWPTWTKTSLWSTAPTARVPRLASPTT